MNLLDPFRRSGSVPTLAHRVRRIRKDAGRREASLDPIALILICVTLVGCARTDYRRRADTEANCLIASRQTDPRWNVPNRVVEPQHHSRMYLAAEDDCGPKPIDDAAANCYMQHPDGIDNSRYYSKIQTKGHTENPVWIDYLPRNDENEIELTQAMAVALALLHSRSYQTAFESVYSSALALSGNRFEFDTQWFGGFGALFSAIQPDYGKSRQLDVTASRLGFTRSLAGGGELAVGVLNGLTWEFSGGGFQAGSAALVSSFTQPLLRGAFRHVRLEQLTQAERDLLYNVRDFARFRRTFYANIVTSYLDLLTQIQAQRNLRINVENLRQNLVEHNFYVQLEMVSQFQRDQVFQEYQNGRSNLLSSIQNLTASMDEFKLQIGLPAWVPFKIDESLLQPFELVNPQLAELQDASQALYESLVEYLPPEKASKDILLEKFDEYTALRDQVVAFLPEIDEELKQWLERLDQVDRDQLGTDDRLDHVQQTELAERVRKSLDEIQTKLDRRGPSNETLLKRIQHYDSPLAKNDNGGLSEQDRGDDEHAFDDDALDRDPLDEGMDPAFLAWKDLMKAIGEDLREEISDLYVAQTQVRLFLIDIEPLSINQYTAISYAHLNRLEVMNAKAAVMDAFRRVEVAADALESDLTLRGEAALRSDPGRNNAYRFDSSAARYAVGLEFDGPLNRLNERNDYRSAQIAYQKASRDFIAERDIVANGVRAVLRRLELARLNFQIARQQLVAATRQVDQAQIDLRRSAESDSNLTSFLLEALEGLLEARNGLMANWITYRQQKMALFVELEMLYLDENGVWMNEATGLDDIQQFTYVDQEYFPPEWVDPFQKDAAVDDVGPKDIEAVEEPEAPIEELPAQATQADS